MEGKYLKRFLGILLCIAFTFSLVGCSFNSTKEADKNDMQSKEEIAEGIATATVQGKIDEPKLQESMINQPKAETIEQSPEAVVQSQVPTQRKTVVVDPGHGAGGNSEKELQSPDSNIMKIKDGGGCEGVSTKIPEYVVTMQISLKLKALLEQNNINVILTRTDNSYSPGNIERAEVGNNNNVALAIRIHCDSADSSSAKGASMLVPGNTGYASSISSISRRYGNVVLNKLVSEVCMYNRGVIERNDMTGFNWSKVPVILVELGFMSNPAEDLLLTSDDYQNKIAKGLCDGIVEAIR